MAGPGGIDLTARTWNDIAGDFVGAEPKGTLLIGNGLSRAVWDDFSYESLLDRATDEGLPDHLTGAQKQIFDTLGTPNFETVLQTLHHAIVAANALGVDPTAFTENYQAIRSALVATVKAVHVPWVWVSEVARIAIGTEMRRHATVYSTNYDLLPYWGMTALGVGNFIDYFFASANKDSFDPIWLPDPGGRTRVFFPHGALHLVQRWNGVASKLKNHGRQLLESSSEPNRSPSPSSFQKAQRTTSAGPSEGPTTCRLLTTNSRATRAPSCYSVSALVLRTSISPRRLTDRV